MKMSWLLAPAFALGAIGFGLWQAQGASTGEAPSAASKRRLMTESQIEAAAIKIPQDALDRRARSELLLKGENVPINPYLPVIESEAEAKRRTVEEIGLRAMALVIVAARAEGLEEERADALVARYRLRDALTPEESAFLRQPLSDDKTKIKFIWRYEAAWTLLWALGYVDTLGRPDHAMDPALAVGLIAKGSRESFIAGAKLRALHDILDEADLIYRYHWATVDAPLNGKALPAGLDNDVIMERHYALNWLIGYMDQDWDDISTDT